MSNRINITLSDENLKKVDKACDDLGIARSTYIAMAVNEKIRNDDAFKLMPDVISSMQTLKEMTEQMKIDNLQTTFDLINNKD